MRRKTKFMYTWVPHQQVSIFIPIFFILYQHHIYWFLLYEFLSTFEHRAGGGISIREQWLRARSRRGGVSENRIAGSATARLFFLTAVAIAIGGSLSHGVHTERQRPLSGVHSITIEKFAQAGEGGGCTPTTFHYSYHHVQSCSVRFS
jgi:hypothetical protein